MVTRDLNLQWMRHPTDRDPNAPPRIWIADSQKKIHHHSSDIFPDHRYRGLHVFNMPSGRYTIPSNQLQRIQEHVDSIHILWQPAVSDRSHNPVEGRTKLKRQILQDISQDFAEGPMGSAQFILIDVDAVKASYAYSLSPKFALSVAFRDVCTIKARSRGLYPMAQEFGQASDVGSSFVRAIKMKDE